jgi:hypothetical protein
MSVWYRDFMLLVAGREMLLVMGLCRKRGGIDLTRSKRLEP